MHVLRIKRDEDPSNPRAWDNPTKMACRHSRHNLGDAHYRIDPRDSLASARKTIPDTAVWMPLYLLDHSGLTISTKPFNCPWDSGQVGFVWIERETIIQEWGHLVVGNVEGPAQTAALKCLEADVAVYNQYLQGDCWGFELVSIETCMSCGNSSETLIDSCWGFYGDDPKTNGMLDHIPEGLEYTIEKEN